MVCCCLQIAPPILEPFSLNEAVKIPIAVKKFNSHVCISLSFKASDNQIFDEIPRFVWKNQ